MQVQQDRSQDQTIEDLQQQIETLKAENLLLQDQLARKEQFTAMIAHDLRGPLSPIINYAQMLARQTRTAGGNKEISASQFQKKLATIQRHTSIIIGQAKRMSRQVNDLLDVTNLSAGKFQLVKESCNMVQIVEDMAEQLRPVAPYHHIVVNTPATPVQGQWDCGRLQQVLGNLLDNAIKYSDEHTTITINVVTSEHIVRVSVHNQGASIPSAEISQLFRPYTRLAATSTRQGSGLGLYIAKSLIEAHHGTLRLEPNHDEQQSELGRGTTFTFELTLPTGSKKARS